MSSDKTNKPYKSLVDVYVESRRPVQENVQIVGIPDGMDQEQLGMVSDKEYQRLKRLVLSKADGGTESLVKQLLRLGRWEETAEIDTLVLDIFLEHDVDVQVLNKLVEKKKSGNLGKLNSCISKGDVWNLMDAVDPMARKLTKNFKQLFMDLTYKVQPKISTVSVGPGEISLSMFTNATKGDVGDLMLDGMELEIKGDGGRLGSSDYTKSIFTTPGNKYLNILADRGQGQHFSQAETIQIRAQLSLKATTALDKFQKVKQVVNKNKDDLENLVGPVNQVIQSYETLKDTKTSIDPELIKTNITSAIDVIDQDTRIPLTKLIIGLNQTIVALLDQLVNTTDQNTDYNWQTSTQYMFNHDWGMSPREMAEAFVEMRTEQMDPGAVASLISAAEKIFKNTDLTKSLLNLKAAQKGKTKTIAQVELQRLQAALMATSYQSAHGFERIIVLNSKTLAASNIKFNPEHDAGQTLISVYRQLKQNQNIHVSNPGVDQRNKGIGISVAS